MTAQEKIDDYNSEPVVYCANCMSLSIKYDEDLEADYCENCGCTIVKEVSIGEWERLYEKRYGRKFRNDIRDIRKSPIFQLSPSELIRKILNSPQWEEIIKGMYGHLPKGMSKTDSVLVFFDKVNKENKLDELRTLLYKMHI